jgi:predicted dithiol-disulfide oxidoreductase (DUF899 family)
MKKKLSELFNGRSQLIVYHFMFDPSWDAGCPSCSFWADNFNGIIVHLNQRDVTMVAFSKAPYNKLAAYEKRMGWNFKWVSSYNTDFNFDYNVSFRPEEVAKKEGMYNFTLQDPLTTERGRQLFDKIHVRLCYIQNILHNNTSLFSLCMLVFLENLICSYC